MRRLRYSVSDRASHILALSATLHLRRFICDALSETPLSRSNYESRRRLSLRQHQILGGYRSRRDRHLSLHRLPGAVRQRVQGSGARAAGKSRMERRQAEDLYQDRGERQQAGAGILPRLRHVALRGRRGQYRTPGSEARHDQAAGAVEAFEADLASVGSELAARLGRFAENRKAVKLHHEGREGLLTKSSPPY